MDIDELLEEIPIEEYIENYVELEENGDELFGECPFHSEKTPSFSVTPSTGCWYCFGCHQGGNLISFVMKYHRFSYEDAIEHLIKYSGVDKNTILNGKLTSTKVIKEFRPKKKKRKQATYKIYNRDVMSRYEEANDKANVWRNEGITDSIMEKYQVKYDAFSNRLVFPIRKLTGEIINISGRTLDPDWKIKKINGKKMRKYNYFSELGILDTFFGFYENKDSIIQKKEIIIFEGAKSVMKAETYGSNNSVAALTSRINPHQLKILIKLGVRVVFALDEEVKIKDIDTVQKLLRFVPVEAVINRDHLLESKMSPVDAGKDVWENLYERRWRLN